MKTGHPAYISQRASLCHWNLIVELETGGQPRHIVTTSAYTLVISRLYCVGSEVRDTRVRQKTVMEADKDE